MSQVWCRRHLFTPLCPGDRMMPLVIKPVEVDRNICKMAKRFLSGSLDDVEAASGDEDIIDVITTSG